MADKMDIVRKLLAQAEGTSNEAEAATYLAKAQTLMTQYGIDEAIGLPSGFELLEQGRFRAGDHTSYGSVAVLAIREEPAFEDAPYSVHTAVVHSDGPFPEDAKVSLISGEYDLTLEQARERLAAR